MEVFVSPSSVPFPVNYSSVVPVGCDGDLHRNSCMLNDTENAKRDAIAILRLVVSCLSILGSLSIIISVLWRRILCSPKIHPIFVISVADCILGISWVIGGAFWLGKIEDRSWCYFPSLLNVIFQCVSVNLTVVYALVAYSVIKNQNLSTVVTESSVTAWKPWKTVTAYAVAWLLPTVIVLMAFGIIGSLTGIVRHANSCSCWCLPYSFSNIPLSQQEDHPTAVFAYNIRKLMLSYAVVLLATYLLGFVLLVFMYTKILLHVRRARKSHSSRHPSSPNYGAVATMLMKGHSQAKKRVVYFLSVFIITGIANVVLSLIFVVFEGRELHAGVRSSPLPESGIPKDHLGPWFRILVYMTQSATAPLQGLLNALVYGWTREDFVHRGRKRSEVRESLVDSYSREHPDDGDLHSSGHIAESQNSDRYTASQRASPAGPPSTSGGGTMVGRLWLTPTRRDTTTSQTRGSIQRNSTGIM